MFTAEYIKIDRDALKKAIQESTQFYIESERSVEDLRGDWERLNVIYSNAPGFPGLSILTKNFVSTHKVCMDKATPENWMGVAQVALRYYDSITGMIGEMQYPDWSEVSDCDHEPTEEEEWKAWAEYMENRNQPSNERATNWLW